MFRVVDSIAASARAVLPSWLVGPLRSTATMILAPVWFASASGHWRSTFLGRPVGPEGQPLPWYTHSCVSFLAKRSFEDRTILEFGGGNSTLWWAERARRVVCIEQDRLWYGELARKVPDNVDLYWVPADDDGRSPAIGAVERILARLSCTVDIAVIDGIGRRDVLVRLALEHLTSTGAIIADDSHGYGFAEVGAQLGLCRVDFYGFRSGVVRPSCTSIFFRRDCFLFEPKWPIVDPARSGLF